MNEGPVTLDIPGELLEAGQILLIEKASEIFVDNVHLHQLGTPIRESHHLCLFSAEKLIHSAKQTNEEQRQSNPRPRPLILFFFQNTFNWCSKCFRRSSTTGDRCRSNSERKERRSPICRRNSFEWKSSGKNCSEANSSSSNRSMPLR